MVLEKDPRSTRIVCTLGPASATPDVLEQMILSGMNVARLNFSHGTLAAHRQTVEMVRQVAARIGRPVAVLQDLQGHKVRVGEVAPRSGLRLDPGQRLAVGFGQQADGDRIGIDYEGVTRFVAEGHSVYLDDGLIELKVTAVAGDELRCLVEVGGVLRSRKGVIFPDSDLSFPLINEKDERDARLGVELDVDMVAMSFVRSSNEIREMRSRLASWGQSKAFIVAKIEESSGVVNLDGILQEANAVLIARGDLGVTVPRERVPSIQKSVVRQANRRGIPVVIATQMLESMTTRRKPSRAEVTDVHHAVVDGTDAVMLSGETATGRYPVRAVEEMDRICRVAEEEVQRSTRRESGDGKGGIRDQTARAAAELAERTGARCIVGYSLSGATLRALSAARSSKTVYGVVADERVLRRLLLHRGLSVSVVGEEKELAALVEPVLAELRKAEITAGGDLVLVVAGVREPNGKRSHLLKLYET